jgi:hypothetical protein
MRPRVVATVVVAILTFAVSASIVQKPLGTTPVVVELFTSQGCSSCPPADELISELRAEKGVIPLAFHVDYWDHLGWKDAFSNRTWTQRQMMYVRTMHLNSAYTPQAVVNGSVQFVGSSRSGMANAIAEASRKPPVGTVSVDATRNGNSLTANVKADAPPDYDVMLVVFQNQAVTTIEAGENAGRHPTEDAIVRLVKRVSSGPVTLTVAPSWKDIGVAVFLQHRDTLQIGNAAVARP